MDDYERIRLKDVFIEHRHAQWYFIQPGGNWGDYLIWAGAENLAAELGLKWTTLTFENFNPSRLGPEDCVYIHGGGGYNSWCSGKPFIILQGAVGSRANLVVQGPQSTEENGKAIGARLCQSFEKINCGQVIFYVRERTSLRAMESIDLPGMGVKLRLDHDTALHLTPDVIYKLAGLKQPVSENYHLVVCREDNEAPQGDQLPARCLKTVRIDPAMYCSSFSHWLKVHAKARSISTNRLHSAIVGALLHKPVYVSPGSYHKNRSIWEYSLKSRGVVWDERLRSETSGLLKFVPLKIRRSYKVNRLMRPVLGIPK
jgi:hypothetical protein